MHAARLRVLEAVRVDDVGVDARLRRERRHRGADVARRDAADLRLALLEQARDRHRHDAVLVGEARARGRVVLEVQVRDPELGAEAVGADQRRVAREACPRAPARARRRSAAAPRSARCCCGRSAAGTSREVPGGQLVVVDDVEALAAVRAGEHRCLERPVCCRSGGRPAGRARARPLPGALRGLCAVCVLMRAP